MNFLKKWMSAIISFIAGVCGLALSATVGMKASALIDASALESTLRMDPSQKVETTTKAYKVLTDSSLYTEAKELGIGSEFMVMKVFAIITLVVSVLLIVYALVMLLKNLNVIKCESNIFNIVGICLFALLLVATVGLLASSNGYASAMEDVMPDAMKAMYAYELTAMLTPLGYASMVEGFVAQTTFSVNVSVGVYQIAMLVISIISALVYGIFTFLGLKKKEA
ncbi:MAG: hypothetical protein IJ371_01155 [Clostridia bacterium]|nr:hypothetical protein [Clostridia bacterium]